MIELLIALFLLSFIIQAFYIYFFLCRINGFKSREPNPEAKNLPGIGVIVCARNEIESLESNLSNLLCQSYNNYEVVVVNDGSTDGSLNFLETMAEKYSHLKIINIEPSEKTQPGKKQALHLGIAETNKEWVLFTDADCIPASLDWIDAMVHSIKPKTEVVLGYSPAIQLPGFFNKFVRFDYLSTAIQFVNFTFSGIPYMGTGRNLLIKKAQLLKTSFNKHLDLIAGDDDLTVNQLSNEDNTEVCLDPKSFVHTNAKSNLSGYWKQKRRHFSVSHCYQLKHIALLFTWNLSKVLLYLLPGLILWMDPSHIWVVFVMAIHFSNLIVMYRINTKFLDNKELILLSPLMDVLSVFFNSFVVVSNVLSRNVEWK